MTEKIICYNCSKKINRKGENAGIISQEKINYCPACLKKVSQGIFRCHEYGCETEIDTTKDASKFRLDLNRNVFCMDCWNSPI